MAHERVKAGVAQAHVYEMKLVFRFATCSTTLWSGSPPGYFHPPPLPPPPPPLFLVIARWCFKITFQVVSEGHCTSHD